MSYSIDSCYDVYIETFPRARKAHICEACDEPISEGHVYVRVSIVFDGEAETVKRCLRCQKIHEHLRELCIQHDCWPSERLDCGEEYYDHWGISPPPNIQALAFVTPEEMQKERAFQ